MVYTPAEQDIIKETIYSDVMNDLYSYKLAVEDGDLQESDLRDVLSDYSIDGFIDNSVDKARQQKLWLSENSDKDLPTVRYQRILIPNIRQQVRAVLIRETHNWY